MGLCVCGERCKSTLNERDRQTGRYAAIDRHTNRKTRTERRSQRDRDRDRDGERDRQTDRQKDREALMSVHMNKLSRYASV